MASPETPAAESTPLSSERIRRALTARRVGRVLHVLDAVDSTNAALRRMAEAGAGDGTVVIADAQSAGHGRAGKAWYSPAGVNLYLSVLLRPRLAARDAGVFSFIASLALVDVIQEERVTAAVKWPNDVLVERRKVGGAQAETVLRDGEVESVILGIGINLNVSRAALRATLGDAGRAADSLREVVGHEIDRDAFAAALLNALDRWAEVFERRGPASIVAAWQDRDIVTGRRVEVRGEGEPYEGRAIGLDAGGHLVVKDSRGVAHHVVDGEIRFVD